MIHVRMRDKAHEPDCNGNTGVWRSLTRGWFVCFQ